MHRLPVLLILTMLAACPAARAAGPGDSTAAPDEATGGAGGPLMQPGSEAQQGQPAPVTVRDEANRFEMKLPAPYWASADRAKLAAQSAGGCGGPRVPPNLMLVLEHKDALARVWCERSERPFLMRNRADLEGFVDAFAETVRKQVGSRLTDSEASYEERDGMIIHTLSFVMAGRTGGGCAGQPAAGDAPKMRVLVAHYFLRPKDEDAIYWKLSCMAPAEVYGELKGESAYILGSFRHTGDLAAEFFVPDAPQDKLLTAKEGARAAGASGPSYVWIFLIGLAVVVWLLTRKRKAQPT